MFGGGASVISLMLPIQIQTHMHIDQLLRYNNITTPQVMVSCNQALFGAHHTIQKQGNFFGIKLVISSLLAQNQLKFILTINWKVTLLAHYSISNEHMVAFTVTK